MEEIKKAKSDAVLKKLILDSGLIIVNPKACQKAAEIKKRVDNMKFEVKRSFDVTFQGLFIAENNKLYDF